MPDLPARPEDDSRWQTLVHGAPVHVSLCAALPRHELPLLLALLQQWSQGLVLSEPDHVRLMLHDPDHTIALDTVTAAVGPGVRVVVLAPDDPHAGGA